MRINKALMGVKSKMFDVKCPYQPPYAEIISIEAQGVLCHSAITTDDSSGIEEMTIDTIKL